MLGERTFRAVLRVIEKTPSSVRLTIKGLCPPGLLRLEGQYAKPYIKKGCEADFELP